MGRPPIGTKMSRISDLVQDAELQTVFHGGLTVHVSVESESGPMTRVIERKEHWKQQEFIGSGSYGEVWLEQCAEPQREAELRAVKRIAKSSRGSRPIDYHRELEAISKFSHPRVLYFPFNIVRRIHRHTNIR